MGKLKQIKTNIEDLLFDIYAKIGINEPQNHYEISDFVFYDVLSNADLNLDAENFLPNVQKSFLKWIESKSIMLETSVRRVDKTEIREGETMMFKGDPRK